MQNNGDLKDQGSSRRAFIGATVVAAVAAPLVGRATSASAATTTTAATASTTNTPFVPDPDLIQMLGQVDPNRIQATIQRLVDFGTRHTLSSQTDPVRGIGAATAWVTEQLQAIAATSSGNMKVQQQTFIQPAGPRIPVPTSITNVIATLQGTASPERFYVITGHLDSRVTDVLDFTSDAPGADDDGSGVAVMLELARLFATRQFPGTLVFATVSGEEQGLFGSTFMAQQMAAAGNDVQGMFSNDIVGASQAFDGTKPDPFTLRLFTEGVPTDLTSTATLLLQLTGGENDSLSRQLGRFAVEVAPFSLTQMNIRHIWRRDRYLRASDHVSFETLGFSAARFTEPRENFDHEHRNVEVVNGVQFGDLIEFVDFDYVARVAKVNGAVLWALATAPGRPKNVLMHVSPPPTFSGINTTTLTWNANPEANLAGYEVVMRETTSADWTDVINVGNVISVTLDVAKDNVQFGVRAVDNAGHRSPVAFPTVTTS
jgi:hypothetical protein